MKTLNDYMAMNYRMEMVEDKEEGGKRLITHRSAKCSTSEIIQ